MSATPRARARATRPVSVRLTVAFEHLRVRLTHHQVVGPRHEVPKRWKRLDDPLDALAGSEETPRQHPGTSPIRSSGTAVAPSSSAVRDHDDLGVVDVVVIDEPLVRRRGHRDQRAGLSSDRVEHLALMPRRLDQHGVQDHDAGHPEPVEDVDDAVTVGAVIDAVLVLHHHHVERVEGRSRSFHRASLAVHHVAHDRRPGPGSGPLEHSNDARLMASGRDLRLEGGGERRQPALGRRKAAQESKRRRHANDLQARA